MQDYALGMGACSIRTCRFPSYSQTLEVGQTTDRCVSVHVAVTVQSVLIQIPPLALPLLPILVSHFAVLEGGESLVHNLTYIING